MIKEILSFCYFCAGLVNHGSDPGEMREIFTAGRSPMRYSESFIAKQPALAKIPRSHE
jgi:hypothetical protein